MSLYRFTRKLLIYFPRRIIVTFALLISAALVEGAGLLLLVPILEQVMPGGGAPSGIQRALSGSLEAVGLELTLVSGLLIFLAVFTAQMGLFFLKELQVARNLTYVKLWLRERSYRNIFAADWWYFLRNKKADLVSAIIIECEKGGNAFYQYLLFWTGIIVISVYSAVALLISWQFTLALFVVGGMLTILFRGRIRKGRDIGTTTAEVNARLQSVLGESFDSAKLIKSSGLEDKALGLMLNEAGQLADLEKTVLVNTARLRAIGEPLVVAVLLLALYAAVRVLEMPFATVLTLMFIFFRLFPRMIKAQQDYFRLLVFIPSFERVEDLIVEAERSRERDAGVGLPYKALKTQIELRDVSYAYEEGPTVLHGVSLCIRKGETVGLTGSSGAGKTTIGDLILGLLEPTTGHIQVDGQPLRDYDIRSWRKRIGYVSQETILLHDTVRANILWGVEGGMEEDELERLARLAHAQEFIEGLANGYDTIIGDRGVRLSGGQRQRLALARALAGDPELLILDEATNALDSEAERRVMEAIEGLAGRVTVFMIAHRLSTLVHADRISFLDAGRIVETGTYEELIRADGPFGRLHRLQMQADQDGRGVAR